MTIDTKLLIPMAEANQNFSKVVRIVDENGMAVILKNNKPRYVVVDFNEYESIRSGIRQKDDEAACEEKAPAEKQTQDSAEPEDPLLPQALMLVKEAGKASTSLLQRHLCIGYGRAARLLDRMEELGYIGTAEGNRVRKVLCCSSDTDTI